MWVARDKDLCLHFFSMKPNRLGNNWCVGDNVSGYSSKLDISLFPNLKWEDEPREVELVPKMVNAVQEKLSEAVDNYFDYIGHVQDIHPYSKEREQEYYNNMCWRWQDWNTVKYDPQSIWELNFEDYVGSKR